MKIFFRNINLLAIVSALVFTAPAVWATGTSAVSGQKLESALIELIKSKPNEKFESSLGSDNVQQLREYNSLDLQVLPPGADPNELDNYGNPVADTINIFSDQSVQGSLISPITSPNRKNSADGVTLFKNDIFAAGFYFRTSDGFTQKVPMKELLHQPWFEYDYKSEKYVYRTDGAQEKIISTIDKNQLSLFHGCGARDADDVTLFSKLNSKVTPDELKSLLHELQSRSLNQKYPVKLRDDFLSASKSLASNTLSINQLKGLALEFAAWKLAGNRFIFFGTAESTGKRWEEGFLVELPISKSYLTQLSINKKVYVGIEYDYIEIAFSDVESVAYMLINGIVKKVPSP